MTSFRTSAKPCFCYLRGCILATRTIKDDSCSFAVDNWEVSLLLFLSDFSDNESLGLSKDVEDSGSFISIAQSPFNQVAFLRLE